MELELRNPGTKTFIDCDDLTDLTRLFSYVGQDSEGISCAAFQYTTEDWELFFGARTLMRYSSLLLGPLDGHSWKKPPRKTHENIRSWKNFLMDLDGFSFRTLLDILGHSC